MLLHYNHTRIHIDDVSGLGNFMELEVLITFKYMTRQLSEIIFFFQVVLSDEESIEDGTKRAEELLEKLGIPKTDLISGSYMDGLMKKLNNSN